MHIPTFKLKLTNVRMVCLSPFQHLFIVLTENQTSTYIMTLFLYNKVRTEIVLQYKLK